MMYCWKQKKGKTSKYPAHKEGKTGAEKQKTFGFLPKKERRKKKFKRRGKKEKKHGVPSSGGER